MLHQIWTKGELDYDLGMEKWGVEIDLSAANSINFLCFIEPWELEAIKKQSAANEFRLIQKYKGVLFFDVDADDDEGGVGKVFKIIESNVEWKKKDKNDKETPCYCVLAKPSADSADDDSNLESFHINEELCRMIRHPQAGHPANIHLKFTV